MGNLAEFEALATPILSDALDELSIAGVIHGVSAQVSTAQSAVGYALPVKFERKEGDAGAYRFGGGVGRPLEKVLKTMQADQVIVFDLGGSSQSACWGGLASRLAQGRGVKGTVVWGACRDMEELEELRFPVWAVCSCPRRSRNEFTFGSIGEPIRIGLTNVAPGDIVVADGTGVVVVPADRASDVLELARSIASSEQRMEAQIQSGLNDIEWDQV